MELEKDGELPFSDISIYKMPNRALVYKVLQNLIVIWHQKKNKKKTELSTWKHRALQISDERNKKYRMLAKFTEWWLQYKEDITPTV